MKKRNLFRTAIIALLGASSLFVSCVVGLGDSVDTEVPELNILKPASAAVIRDAFAFSGTWKDDGEIDSFKLTIKSSDSKVSYSYDVDYVTTTKAEEEQTESTNEKKYNEGTWLCKIDPFDENTLLADGSYEVTLEITDKGSHTKKDTRAITIDNTAPLVIIDKPGTGVSAGIDDLDGYGQIITLEGSAADDNNVDHIDITFYKDYDSTTKKCSNPLKTVTLKNVPPAIKMKAATYEKGTANDYAAIYGATEVQDIATQYRYCELISYDSAMRYPADGSEQTEADKLGNSTNIYYLSDDISDNNILTEDINISKLYDILSGDCTEEEKSILTKLSGIETHQSYFSVNPQNNPTFTLSGHKELKKDGRDFDVTVNPDYIIYQGSTVTVEVSAGLDSYELDQSTLCLVVYECDAYGVIDESTRTVLQDKGTAKANGSSKTSYKWDNVSISTADGLKINKSYIFKVEGNDVQKNEVLPNGTDYGFILQAKGSVTAGLSSISVNGGADLISSNMLYVPAKKPASASEEPDTEIQLSGYVILSEGVPSVKVSVDGKELVSKLLSASDLDTTYKPADEDDNSKQYLFSATVNAKDFPSPAVSGQHNLIITGSNGTLSSSAQKILVYDCDNPIIGNFAITPSADKYDLTVSQTDAIGHNYLNGTVTMALSIRDEYSQVADAKIEFYKRSAASTDDADWELYDTKNPVTGLATLSYELNTADEMTKVLDGDGNPVDEISIKIVVTATDRAGNITSESYFYTINQSTDTPAVLVQESDKDKIDLVSFRTTDNSGNAVDKTILEDADLNGGEEKKNYVKKDGQINLKVVDDDGISTIVTTIYDASGNVVKTYESDGNAQTAISYPFQMTVSEYGYYKVKIVVTDTGTGSYTLPEFWLRVISDKPQLNLTKDISVVTTNTANVTSPVNEVTSTLTISSTMAPFTVERTLVDSASPSQDVAAYTKTYTSTDYPALASDSGSVTFAETISMDNALSSGIYKIKYEVTDNTASSATAVAELKVDNDAPAILTINIPTAKESETGSYTFSGTAEDKVTGAEAQEYQSGISNVKYSIKENSSGTVKASGVADSTTDWKVTSDFSSWTEGKYTISLYGTDAVGNIGSEKSQEFWFDKASPSAKISSYVDKDGTEAAIDGNDFYYGYTFTLKGAASDTNALDTVTLQQTDASGNTISIPVKDSTTNIIAADGTWTIAGLPWSSADGTFAGDSDTKKLNEGSYSYKLIAKDVTGKESESFVQKIIVDNTAPEVVINAPAENAVLKGSSTDLIATPDKKGTGSDIAALYYAITDSSTAPAKTAFTAVNDVNDGAAWTLNRILGTGTTGSADAADLYEGKHYLHVYVTDKAKNESKTVSRVFYVDQTAPSVTISVPVYAGLSAKDSTGKAKVKVSGTVTETNKLQTLKLYRSGTAAAIKEFTIGSGSGNIPETPSDAEWSYDDYFEIGKADGNYTYTIEANDEAGVVSSAAAVTGQASVIVDTVAPAVDASKISTPTVKQTEETSFRFEGAVDSVTDTNTTASPSSDFDRIDFAFTSSATAPSARQFTVMPGFITSENKGKWSSLQSYAIYPDIFGKGTTEDPYKQGTKYLWLKVYDKAGNSSEWTNVSFNYDTASPAVSETTVASDGLYKNGTFTLGGTASDTQGVKKVEVVAADKNDAANKKTYTVYTKADAAAYQTSYSWSKELSLSENGAGDLKDGEYTFTITVTDAVDKTSTASRSVIIDTTKPAIGSTTTGGYTDYVTISGGAENGKNYYKTKAIRFAVNVSDNLSKVETVSFTTKAYRADDERTDSDWTDLTKVSDTLYTGTVTFENDGENVIYLKVKDVAGNVRGEKEDYSAMTFNIDSTSPSGIKLYSDAACTSEVTGEIVTKADKAITYYAKATDGGVGIKGFAIGQDYTSAASRFETETAANSGIFAISIPTASQDGVLNLSVSDRAGNCAWEKTISFKKDNSNPVITLTAPAADAINGTVKIAGYVEDKLTSSAASNNGMVTQIKFEYSLDNSTWKQFSSADTISDGLANSKESFSIERQFSSATKMLDLVSGALTLKDDASTESKPVYLKITAYDQAGNSGTLTKTLTIDRNSDRPTINLTGYALDGMSGSNYVWVKNTTVISGTVSDDDGVSSIQISRDGGASYKDVSLNKTSWSFDIQDFFASDKENSANAHHSLLFKVTDNEGNTYTSGTTSGLSSIYLMGSDKKQFGSKTTGYTDTTLYVAVDTINPNITPKGVRFATTGDFSANYTTLSLGGSRNVMQFKVEANDGDNEMDTVTGTATFTYKSGTTTTVKKTLNFTSTTAPTATDDFYVVNFDVDKSNLGIDETEGTVTVELTAYDEAGNQNYQSVDFSYDYKKPVITVTSPGTSQPSSGKVTAYGTINENVTMYYALSTSATIAPGNTVTTWTGKNADTDAATSGTLSGSGYVSTYTQVVNPGLAWFLNFDGESGENHSETFTDFLITAGVATDEAIKSKHTFTDIVNVYFWTKAVDDSGNIYEGSRVIPVDPQGERPTVEISSPADSETLGGSITINGSATPKSSYTIQNVWVQLVSSFHAATLNSKSYSTTNSYGSPVRGSYSIGAGDLDYLAFVGYDVYNMKTYSKGTNTNKWVCGSSTLASYNTTDYTAAASDFGILIETNGSTGWSLKVNEAGEFNNTNQNEQVAVAIRVYAEDNANHISSQETYFVNFDAGNPVISNISLRQYSGTTVTASRNYEENMYVSGQWYLYANVSDNDTIETLKITDASGNTLSDGSIVTNGTSTTVELKYALTPAATNEVGKKAIQIVATDGTGIHSTTKVVTVNYDNKDPELAASTDSSYDISAEVKQSNGFYSFGSKVNELTVSGSNQSGLDFVAFYFTSGKTATNVYDVMMKKGSTNAIFSTSGMTAGSDGLYWKSAAVSSTTATSFTTASLPANAHKGGLVKLGNVIYIISGISGTTVTIDGTLDELLRNDSSYTGYNTAYFAIANVINNTKKENGSGTKETSNDYGYGYYQYIGNDDGDLMVEAVETDGTWSASINSRNMPDGSVTLHYVAYDKAGNFTKGTDVSAYVSNNAPRIAGIKIETDINGDGVFTADTETVKRGEVINLYNAANKSAGSVTGTTSGGAAIYDPDEKPTSSANKNPLNKTFTVDLVNDSAVTTKTFRGKTQITPEVVGGNGAVFFTASGVTASNNNGKLVSAGSTDYTAVTASPIVLTTANLVATGNKTAQEMTFTFYDSTWDTSATAIDTTANHAQTAELKLTANIHAIAADAPEVKIKPFHWTSFSDNSIYGSDEDTTFESINGHIELEDDLSFTGSKFTGSSGVYDTDPKVSGQIVITGTAHDDVRIQKLYFSIPGMDLKSSDTYTSDSVTYYCLASIPSGGAEIASDYVAGTNNATYNTNGFMLDLTNTYSEAGHDIAWTLTWDTSKITNIAAKDVVVQVLAKNVGKQDASYTSALTTAPTTTQTTATETSRYRMDVVPYISRLATKLAPEGKKNTSVYGRTALGKYPVYYYTNTTGDATQGETYTKLGFNLGTSVTVTTDSSSASGAVSQTVNSITTLNNENNNAVEYNQQHNGMNNDLLTDDVSVLVWDINSKVKTSSKGGLKSAVMRVNPTSGALGYSYIHKGDLTFNLNGTDSTDATSTYVNGAFIYDKNGEAFGMYSGTDLQINDGNCADFKLAYSKWGKPDGDNSNGRTRRLEKLGYVDSSNVKHGSSGHFGIPSLAASTAGNNLYLMYYDTIFNELKFRAGNGYSNSTGDFGDFHDVGSNSISNTDYNYASVVANSTTLASGGVGSVKYGPGQYCAIAVVSNSTAANEVVVAVWFDFTQNTLWYSYITPFANSATKTGSGSNTASTAWAAPKAILNGTAGGNCAIAVDKDGHVHIAAYSSEKTGSLVYAYLDAYNSAYDASKNLVMVDSYGTAGDYLSIDFAKAAANGTTVPYIGYWNAGSNYPKYAYLADTESSGANGSTWSPKAGVDSNDKYTGYWEEVILPTVNNNIITKHIINLGVYKNSSTNVIGTTQGPASTTNPAIAYGILKDGTGYFECAQIK